MSPEHKLKLLDALDLLGEAQHMNEAAFMATNALDKRPRDAMAQIIGHVQDRLADVRDLLDALLPEESQ